MDDLDELAQASRQVSYAAPSTTRRPRRKGTKVHQLIGGTLVVAGFIGWIIGTKLQQEAAFSGDHGGLWTIFVGCGVLAFVLGTVWYLAARLATWWNDETC